ncbi:hypothetical protein ES708_04737 [subsurface metagenome]
MIQAITEPEELINERRNPGQYMRRLSLDPFPWQWEALDPASRRVMMLTCRQAGKSTVVAGKTLCRAKSTPGALNLITCPAQDQSKELIKKVEQFVLHDPFIPRLTHDGSYEKQFENRSRIVALPGSERSVRGYSVPKTIIIDEAAQVQDSTIFAMRPMMIGADTELFMLSTPHGKRGYFYRQWDKGKHWKKILVRIGWDLKNGKLVPAMPEAQFHAQMLKQGILAYYSPRHTLGELQEELESMDELWFRQEYLCEFVDELTMVFPTELVDQAMSNTVRPLQLGVLSDEVKPLEVGCYGR